MNPDLVEFRTPSVQNSTRSGSVVRVRVDLAYDGAGFHGFARQPGVRTVQGVLEEALGRLLGGEVRTTGAGRTDAGVHALGQVVSVDVDGAPPAERAAEALNAALLDDVAVVAAETAPRDFHARHSARARSYR